MARLRYNGLTATLGAALTSSATSVTFGAALTHANGVAVPTIASPDYLPLSILDSSGNFSEIVYLTAYTSGATTGTITRAAEGAGAAVAHNSGDRVVHGPTVRDITPPTDPETSLLAMTSFDSTEMKARFFTSIDGGRTFTELARSTPYADPDSTISVRDSSIIRFGGYYLLAHTRAPISNPGGASSTWGLVKSTDLLSWSQVAIITPPAPTGITTLWAPDFLVDGDRLYVYWSVTVSPADGSGNHQTYVSYATAADLTSWSTPTLVSGLGSNVIDTTVVRNGSQYVAIFKNETTKRLFKATASSPLGPFTAAATNIPTGSDDVEGPTLIRTPAGRWRLYYDAYVVHQLRFLESDDLFTWDASATNLSMPSGSWQHPDFMWLSFDELAGLRAQWTRVKSVAPGTNVTVDNSDPFNPVVTASPSGGSSAGILLLANGADVPAGTAAGTIIYEKAAASLRSSALGLSPTIALDFNEISGNFADSGSNAAAFTPGAGVVRDRPAILAGGNRAVAGGGSGNIASLSGNPTAFASNGVGTILAAVRFNAPQAKGTIIKFGGASNNGWSLDVGTSTVATQYGNQLLLGRNGVGWSTTNIAWVPGIPYIAALTHDASNNYALWLNGQKLWSASAAATNALSGGGPIVGDDNSGTAYLAPVVDVDFAAWWNTVLTDAQLTSLGTVGVNRGAKGWWDGSLIQPLV